VLASDPYHLAPDRAFWARSVSGGFDPATILDPGPSLLRRSDRIVSAGSCFAANIVPSLERAGFTYLRTEATHPAFAKLLEERFGYSRYSAAYGNVYTARQLLQLLKRALGMFSPAEDRWVTPAGIVDPFRPGLRYCARSEREFDLLTSQHLGKTQQAFEQASLFIFTLGLTEAWVSRLDGAVFPACPGTVAGSFDPERHAFRNFDAAEVTADLREFVGLLRSINTGIRIILTVSPVPLVATATEDHVVTANAYSKSVLRVAAAELAKHEPDVAYFPAYEIITGPQAPEEFFAADRRSVSVAGINSVVRALLAHSEAGREPEAATPPEATAGRLSRIVSEAECEEATLDIVAAGDGKTVPGEPI
jgi:hypothetical protein